MRGKDFENSLKNSGKNMKELSDLFGVYPSTLYDLFKKETIPEKYITKAKALGFLHDEKQQNTIVKHSIAPTLTEVDILRQLVISQQETILNFSKILSSQKSETLKGMAAK